MDPNNPTNQPENPKPAPNSQDLSTPANIQPQPTSKLPTMPPVKINPQLLKNFGSIFSGMDPKQLKMLKIAGIVFALTFVLLIVLSILKSLTRTRTVEVLPTPSAIPTLPPAEENLIPSRYATDSAVINIEEKVRALDRDMSQTDFRDTELKPPALNYDINFK